MKTAVNAILIFLALFGIYYTLYGVFPWGVIRHRFRCRREDLMRLTPSVGLLCFVSVCLLAGCETQSQWSPTVDTYGNSRAQYLSQDMEECRALELP